MTELESLLQIIAKATYDVNFGEVPDKNIYFWTTSIRHFAKGLGIYDTNTSKIRSAVPNMHAKLSNYGRSRPKQPKQNLIALFVFLHSNNSHKFEILDVSPIILA